jgi:hypothetical protein
MRRRYRTRLPRREVHRRIDVYVDAVIDGVGRTARRRRLAPATVRNFVRWVERARARAKEGRCAR